ncbi:hypothetical protein D9M68_714670 [compost metagenome]
MRDHHAGFDQQRIGIVREYAGQAAPAFGRVAQAEGPGDLARQATPLEVGHGARRGLELLHVGVRGLLQHVVERHLFLPLQRCALTVLWRGVVLGYLQAGLLGQVLHGLDKGHAGMLHLEADGVAVGAAAEAVVELLGRADAERRRFFAVERTQPHQVGSAFFQLDVAAHHVDHVDAVEQFLDEGLGDGHRGILTDGPPPGRGAVSPRRRCPRGADRRHPATRAGRAGCVA